MSTLSTGLWHTKKLSLRIILLQYRVGNRDGMAPNGSSSFDARTELLNRIDRGTRAINVEELSLKKVREVLHVLLLGVRHGP